MPASRAAWVATSASSTSSMGRSSTGLYSKWRGSRSASWTTHRSWRHIRAVRPYVSFHPTSASRMRSGVFRRCSSRSETRVSPQLHIIRSPLISRISDSSIARPLSEDQGASTHLGPNVLSPVGPNHLGLRVQRAALPAHSFPELRGDGEVDRGWVSRYHDPVGVPRVACRHLLQPDVAEYGLRVAVEGIAVTAASGLDRPVRVLRPSGPP